MLVSYKNSRLFLTERLNLRNDLLFPVWSNALSYHFQGFSFWHLFVLLKIQTFIHFLESWMSRIIELNHRWRIIIRLPPKFNLFFSIFHSSFFFAVALQGSVMSFVYFPRFNRLNLILNAHFLTNKIQCFSGSNQARCKSKFKVKS